MMPSMQRSERVVNTLMEVDPGFQQLAAILYGPSVEASEVYADVFSKREPQKAKGDTQRRVAAASNALGLTAGAAAIGSTLRDDRLDPRDMRNGKKVGAPVTGRVARAAHRAGRLIPAPIARATQGIGTKGAGRLALGAAGLQLANVAGDVVVARTLPKAEKKPKVAKSYYVPVDKALPVKDQAKGIYASMKRMLVPTGEQVGRFGANLRDKPLETLTKTPAGAGIVGGTLTYGATKTNAKRRENKAFQEGYYAKADVSKGTGKLVLAATAPLAIGMGIGEVGGRRIGRKRFERGEGPPMRAVGALKGKDAEAWWNTNSMERGYYRARNKARDKEKVEKAVPDLELAGTFSKFDDEKRQAFGYASVVKKNGLPVIDRQGDYIDLEEMEKAAYHYVQKSRVGGDMHRRNRDEHGIDRAHHVSDLIESMVFTEEKCKQMGLPDEVAKQLDGHWWVGYQIHDEDTWQEVRKKGRTGFSIHGRGKRVDTTIDELVT